MLSVVRPRLVIAFGNSDSSAYAYFASKLPRVGEAHSFKAGHANWECRGFHTSWQGQKMYIAGIPHMSYYSPTGPDGAIKPQVERWLRTSLEGGDS